MMICFLLIYGILGIIPLVDFGGIDAKDLFFFSLLEQKKVIRIAVFGIFDATVPLSKVIKLHVFMQRSAAGNTHPSRFIYHVLHHTELTVSHPSQIQIGRKQ